jgi:hypothetical protein
MKTIRLAVFAALVGSGASIAHADFMFRPAVTYTSDESGTSPTTKTTRRVIDLGAGYVSPGGWSLLAVYGMENRKVEAPGSSTTGDRTSLGAGGGWTAGATGAYVDAVYFFQAEYSVGSTNYKGTGWQVDLGYKFDVGRLQVGPQLTYRNFSYDKVNGATQSPVYKQNNLDPMFALCLMF